MSRLRGFDIARGPVIIFLDAHTEANQGWLEPLCHQIMKQPNAVCNLIIHRIALCVFYCDNVILRIFDKDYLNDVYAELLTNWI